MAARGRVVLLEGEAQSLREKVAPLEEEVRQLKENLRALVDERDESQGQATEASLRADSLARDLEDKRSEGQSLRVQMKGKPYCLILFFWVSTSHVSTSLSSLELHKDLDTSIQTSLMLSQVVDQKMVELKELSGTVAELNRDLRAVDVPSGESLRSRMQSLSIYVRSELRKAIYLEGEAGRLP